MTEYLLLTLLPTEPTDPQSFLSDLQDLVVTAYDLSVLDSVNGIKLGTASGVHTNFAEQLDVIPGNSNSDKLITSILPHFSEKPPDPNTPQGPNTPPLRIYELYSVATAVIVIDPNPPPQHSEFPTKNSYDIRVLLQRNSQTVGDVVFEYNVPVVSDPLSPDPRKYFPVSLTSLPPTDSPSPAAYVFVPPKPQTGDPNRPFVELSSNGQPPDFVALVQAVNKVLELDQTSNSPGEQTSLEYRGTIHKPLSPAQSHHIALELVYDRTRAPLPKPKRKVVEAMYTGKDKVDGDDQDRKRFEGELKAYHASHDADALRLANYIFSASAAMYCEQLSWEATTAKFTFPLLKDLKAPAATTPTISILLNMESGVLSPTFIVPAPYFYVLGSTFPLQLTPDDRFRTAVTNTEEGILKILQTFYDADKKEDTQTTSITGANQQKINIAQAARRLYTLGAATGGLPTIKLKGPVSGIVAEWLQYDGRTADINDKFWEANFATGPRASDYVDLLLQIITADGATLTIAIKDDLHVTSIAALIGISDKGWHDFFIPPLPLKPTDPPDLPAKRAALLPDFTIPGNTERRTAAFITFLKKLLTLNTEVKTAKEPGPQNIPILEGSRRDALAQFIGAYLPPFSFADALNDAAIDSTLSAIFPNDKKLQLWTKGAISTLWFLHKVTKLDGLDPKLQFSYMEALYARGFTTTERVTILSQSQFQQALVGTVVYTNTIANKIYALAGTETPDPEPEPGFGFCPVNPGDLVNCFPPPNLSPLGPIEYLHQILRVPIETLTGNSIPIAEILSARRGSVAELKASMANLETAIPLIDLVNESLEYLGSNLTSSHGAVYNTNSDSLAGFKLGRGPKELPPDLMLDTVPEHSTPAVPVESPSVYEALKNDFSATALPYAQDLDICRAYLSHLNTTRFSAMRHFRRDITEFVLDPANEPTKFQRHLWRFPVRLDIAIEYLTISRQELDHLYTYTLSQASTAAIFGFPSDDREWLNRLSQASVFMGRTGLTYCEFLELMHCNFVSFGPGSEARPYPSCQPCCMTPLTMHYGSESSIPELQKLAVFIRLWRRLNEHYGKGSVSFALLADICQVLHLFNGDQINSDFIRQLISLFMLRDTFCMTLCHEPTGKTPQERIKLLALWIDPSSGYESWTHAVEILLYRTEDYAKREYHCPPREAHYRKVISDNLNALSQLAGFTRGRPWYSTPSCTLRFAEILAKLYASRYTVGEIIFLFTAQDHLTGDDPFPYTEPSESEEDPLNLPEDSHDGLWDLRRNLLNAHVNEDATREWTWSRIENTLRREFRIPHSSDPRIRDPLQALGEHFFPCKLEAQGHRVPNENRQFRTPLSTSDTTVMMWDAPPHEPFHYNGSTSELWAELPLRDEDVLAKLSHLRQLKPAEQAAVRQLYSTPRLILAPFAHIFTNFSQAVDWMIQEPDEAKRFAFFQLNFAKFYCRCRMIAEYLADHVLRVTDTCDDEEKDRLYDVAWRILRSLVADENRAQTSWENDTGQPPDSSTFSWDPFFSGSAFSALLGLVGTGLLGEYRTERGIQWREVCGPLCVFGHIRNRQNIPIPTVIPELSITPSAAQQNSVIFRNGFALRDSTGQHLGGGTPFSVTWTGVLLVEKSGKYQFSAGHSWQHELDQHYGHDCGHHRDRHHKHHSRQEHPPCDDHACWLITVQRGQKNYMVLNHEWEASDSAPSHESLPIRLLRGAYDIVLRYSQISPTFTDENDIHPMHTGFQVKYCGPDTQDRSVNLPIDKLFLTSKDGPLSQGLDKGEDNSLLYLRKQYVSSIRDIRRTYQRAFKAILFAHRFQLSAEPNEYCHGESEVGFLLDHPSNFLGTSYYHSTVTTDAIYTTHQAYFDFNFLPVIDAYTPPDAGDDIRVSPSPRRMSALFDWWERIFDYTHFRRQVHHDLHEKPSRRLPWFLFYEAAVQQPADAKTLIRHLGLDMSLSPLVLVYFDKYTISTNDLEDERWSIRVWFARRFLDRIQESIYTKSLETARPDLWASNDPNLVMDATVSPPLSGNQNLMHFFQTSCLVDNAVRQFYDIRKIDNGLRERARTALLAFLCGMNRVQLFNINGKPFATIPQDLSALLLQDVEVALCEHSSRIEDAIQAVQALVQRVRLGIEPSYRPLPDFPRMWDSRFCTLERWVVWQRRQLYIENWIQWEELHQARKSEAFQFWESELKRHTLTISSSTPSLVWQTDNEHPGRYLLEGIQSREFAEESVQRDSLDEGVHLIGVPAPHARPSWLAPVMVPPASNIPDPDGGVKISIDDKSHIGDSPDATSNFPMWFKAAVRLGTRFIRVAAAGLPPAMCLTPKVLQDIPESCACLSGQKPPVIDEYYFWLTDGRRFDSEDAKQDADLGSHPPDPTSDWDDADILPKRLHWSARATVHLAWTRVHLGMFEPPRRSDEGVLLSADTITPSLFFQGREADSLHFGVLTAPSHGYRYDIVTDSAVVDPQIISEQFSKIEKFPDPLAAYPYFIYFNTGAPLIPITPFGTAMITARTLRTHCCFEAALKWCQLAFDPLQRCNAWAQCPPMLNIADAKITSEGRDEPCCPSAPVKSGIGRGRAAVLEYVEILLQWGDKLMCRNSTESIQQALILFNEASRILGPHPIRMDAQNGQAGQVMTISQFKASAAPLNPRLMRIFEVVTDRCDMVHRCLNARRLLNGRFHKLNLNQPQHNFEVEDAKPCRESESNCMACCPNYRYASLYPRAIELVSLVKSLGGALLSAYEKGDAEYLAALRTAHDRQLVDLNLEVKQLQFREADWQVQALDKQMEGAETRLRYYQQLLERGLNTGEIGYESATNVAMGSRTGGNVSEGISQTMAMIPDFSLGGAGAAGSPLTFNQLPIGTKLAGAFTTAARILNTVAEISTSSGGLMSTQGGWDRRAEEWRHQVDVIEIEIAQIKRQELAADRRRDTALRELNNHSRQMEHSAEVQDFMRDKLTKHNLYLFLQQETAALYRQAYDMALQTARETQQAFRLERGDVSFEFEESSWDNLHEGLMAGDRLELGLRTMDRLYMKTNCREYELTKHISLRLHSPLAFLKIKALGWCEFDIPEWMFDLDYPGHYMRRIKNVTLTIPCVVGPYVGVHCRLQQLSSGIRMDPNSAGPRKCCCNYTDTSKHSDQKDGVYDHYNHICRRFTGTEAITTSSGQNDAGLFELNFHDERYVPFEYSGAISHWRLDIPQENNEFDLETVSDLVMHINYTAREGGATLRHLAEESARHNLPGGGIRLFDLRHEFPEIWNVVFATPKSFGNGHGKRERSYCDFPLQLRRRMFPFLTGRRAVRVIAFQIFIETNIGLDEKHIEVQFMPDDKYCKDEKRKFACVAAADMPRLYHGILEVNMGPIAGDTFHTLGSLRFLRPLCRIKQASLLYHYVVQEDGDSCTCGHRTRITENTCVHCGRRKEFTSTNSMATGDTRHLRMLRLKPQY